MRRCVIDAYNFGRETLNLLTELFPFQCHLIDIAFYIEALKPGRDTQIILPNCGTLDNCSWTLIAVL